MSESKQNENVNDVSSANLHAFIAGVAEGALLAKSVAGMSEEWAMGVAHVLVFLNKMLDSGELSA